MFKFLRFALVLIGYSCVMQGCSVFHNATPEEKRQAILLMKDKVLTELFTMKPSARNMLNNAQGYAVFDNGNVNLFLVSVGGGHGVVKDNRNGTYLFMKMAEAGLGLGIGVKDFRAVLVFHDAETLNRFIHNGWQMGAHADAAAKAGLKGAALGTEVSSDNITIFQFTENGIALQAQIKGAKFWKDNELNQ